MITTIIFDCFGVLTTDGWLPLKRELFGNEGESYEAATELNRQFNAGSLNYAGFTAKIASLSGMDEVDVRSRLETNIPNEPLLAYIENQLAGTYKIGMLSNAGTDRPKHLFTEAQIKLFDAIALSHETGFNKPELGAYQIIAKRLESPPKECLFIDDQPSFCHGAGEAGMRTLCFDDETTLIKRLQELLLQDANLPHT
jgi:FMN phosphatase YigB (HAD superfamily)